MSGATEQDEGAVLDEVLRAARDRGFIGANVPIGDQVAHASAFADAVTGVPVRAVDLGSGGGLPGLVLARRWPTTRWALVDAQQKRTEFLTWAVERLGWGARVEVWHRRAEDLARDPQWRGRCDLVVARSFGPPPVVAECAAGFLQVGGLLVVSEPPDPAADRWGAPAAIEGLHLLGLRARVAAGPDAAGAAHPGDAPPDDRIPAAAPPPSAAAPHLRVFEQEADCPSRFPRRAGIPAKRPLF